MSSRRLTRGLAQAAFASIVASALAVSACGSDRTAFDSTNGSSGGGGDGTSAPSEQFGTTDGGANEAGTQTVVGWLKGVVVAPEGTVPISNAMVYLTSKAPEPLPAAVYCDTCVHLTPLEPYAYSKPDGTFELAAYATGKQWLVVQKGQFRRVREIDVVAGDQNVPGSFTRLPSKTDYAAGDIIPKIAVAIGGFDKIDLSLGKLGIEEFYRYGDGPISIGPTPGIKTNKSRNDLMTSATELGGYHIALFPCATFGWTDHDNGHVTCGMPGGDTQNALKSYVEAGGKVYVTDYSYEAVRQTWPGFVTFYDDENQPLNGVKGGTGTACRMGSEDTTGVVKDPDLGAWMNAIGETNITLHASYTRIQSVSPQPGVDEKGQPVTITPKVWMASSVEGGKELPATISFEQKCGRVLFSTYHAEGNAEDTLLAQEKALLYVLLEVAVCVGELPPPPPPR